MSDPFEYVRQQSAQNTITIRRVKNGDSLFMTIGNASGRPLYQSISDGTPPVVAPDWTVDTNRPVMVPSVKSAMGNAVTILNPVWLYNGTALSFGFPDADGWAAGTGAASRFAFRASDNAIKPVANLAGADNLTNDTLTFRCTAESAGGYYDMEKSVDVIIARGGPSAYYGFIEATNLSLDEENPTAVLVAQLWCRGVEITDCHVRWWRDSDELNEAGQHSITVTREGVDGSQIYIARFYLSATDTDPVATAGVTVIDTADSYQIVFRIDQDNDFIDDTAAHSSVTVKAELINKKGVVQNPANILWRLDVVDKETFTRINATDATSDTDTIVVKRSHTDRMVNGVRRVTDVEVMAEASWGIKVNNGAVQMEKADADLRPEPYWRAGGVTAAKA